MFFRLVLISILLFVLSSCKTGPQPEEDEFSQLRAKMQQQQSMTFGNSVKNLENRKNKNYKKKKVTWQDLDTSEKDLEDEAEAERQRWIAVDIDVDEAEDWKALGLSPKRAIRWKRTGLSYNTIGVLIKEDILPSEAISFMNKKFDHLPKAFSLFAEPLYEFQSACQTIIKASDKNIEKTNKLCRQYVQLLDFSAVSGYLADEYQDTDLSLEYISKLRQVDNQKQVIQQELATQSQILLINETKKTYALIFPFLETSPSKEEMYFIKKNKLALKNTHRYKSYEYYDFWINKDKVEEKARLAIISKQKALEKAKKQRLKAESNKLKALAYNKMVAAECGEPVTAEPSTGEKVHIEGQVLHVVGKPGSNIFAYIVHNSNDNKSYLVRDAKATKQLEIKSKVSWTAITVGRVVSVSLDDDGTASYNHYADEDKEYYPMLKKHSSCAYFSKKIKN